MKIIEYPNRLKERDRSNIYYTIMDTLIGKLVIASTERGLVRIMLPSEERNDFYSYINRIYPEETLVEDQGGNQQVIDQLHEYFNGDRTTFSLSLELRGTEFQRSVWKVVSDVPYGQTRSYGEIAREIGRPKACRAVGGANGANPIPIVIPCHRVIGSDGSMTGFGGGIPLKKKLLRLEKTT